MADITPTDIVNKEFGRVFRGYASGEVDDFLQLASDSLFHALEENQRLRLQVEGLTEEVKRYQETEDLIKNAIVLAERTAEDCKAHAQHEVNLLLRDVDEQIHAQRAEMETLRQTRQRFFAEMRAALTAQLSMLDAQEQRTTLSADVPRARELS